MLEYPLQREGYYMETFRTVNPYGLREKNKFMNKDNLIVKLFPPLPRYGERSSDIRTQL